MKSWTYDGGEDIHKAFNLSGEPLAPQVAATYGEKPREQWKASQIAENNVAKREYQKEYMEYWNSTETLTGTGRPVDALIIPVAPFSAPRPTKYTYYGYTTIFNLLDYTSCTFPVTNVDRNVDVIATDFEPVSDHDTEVSDGCE